MWEGVRSYLDDDLTFLARQGRYELLRQLGALLSGFLVTWLLTNFTSKTLYGQYTFVLATMGVAVIFAHPGMQDAIVESVARGYDSSYLRGAAKALAYSCIGSIAVAGMAVYQFLQGSDVLAFTFLVVTMLFPLYYTMDTFSSYLRGKERFRENMWYWLCIYVAKIGVVAFFVFVLDHSILTLIALFLGTHVLLFVYLFSRCDADRSGEDPELFSYAWFLTKMQGLIRLTDKVDRFVIGLFFTPAVLAVYSIAVLLADKTRALGNSVFETILPRFATDEMQLSWTAVSILLLLGVVGAVGLVIAFPVVIRYVFPGYQQSVLLGQLYAVSLVPGFANEYLLQAFRGLKDREAIYRTQLFSRLSYVVLFAVLVFSYSLKGAVVARIAQHGLLFGGLLLHAKNIAA